MLKAYPFKGPFKGKRAALRLLIGLEAEHASIQAMVARLVEAWKCDGSDDTEWRLELHVRRDLTSLRRRSGDFERSAPSQHRLESVGDQSIDTLARVGDDSRRLLVAFEAHRWLL